MKKVLALLKAHHFSIGMSILWPGTLLLTWLGAGHYGWSREQAWQAMALISAGSALLMVLRRYRRSRQEKSIENLVQIEVDQRNTGHAEQRELSDRLTHAIALLRSHKNAGGAGGAALSDLPWYLVMGTSASGKTSLLSRSGLAASLATNANETQSDKRHCDWYFSPEAVLVDTAGRYLMDDESAEQFSGFLRNLRKQRRHAAINGLVLVVSLPELLTASLQQRAALAARMVTRILQYGESLGSNPPIYLMFSKLDLLPGFVDAFDDLDLAARQRPLGMTFSLAELNRVGLRQLMLAKFPNLHAQVHQRVQARMTTLGAAASCELLNLPDYFAHLPRVLAQFLQYFDAPQPGKAPLLVRGLYFTSALQDGSVLNPIIEERLAREFALRPGGDAAAADTRELRQARSFFITDTFRQVIFPDCMLAAQQNRSAGRNPIKPAALGLGAALGLCYLAWAGFAFWNNDTWLQATAAPLHALASAPDREQQIASGQALEMLGLQLGRIDQYRTRNVPLQLSAGLYHGSDLYPTTQAAYLRQLRTHALEPILQQLQLQLQLGDFNNFSQGISWQSPDAAPLKPGTSTDAAAIQARAALLSDDLLKRLDEHQVSSIIAAYNRLKLYLMLTQPSAHPDAEFLAMNLPAAWAQAVSPVAGSTEVTTLNTPLYLNMLEQGAAPPLPRNDRLIEDTRRSLKAFMMPSSLADREYLRLQLQSQRQFPALTLADLVPEPGRQLFYGSEAVPAMYTRQGWESFVQPQLLKAMSGSLHVQSDWVLEGDGGDGLVQKATFVRDFMSRYKSDYAQAWSTFVASVGMRHFSDLENATQRLALLSDVQLSPLKDLLAAVHQNTRWDLPIQGGGQPPGAKPTTGWLKALSALGPKADADIAALSTALPAFEDGQLATRFEPVARLFAVQGIEAADDTVMNLYLGELRKLKVRMSNIQRSQDVGASSKQLISETLQGQASEVTNLRNYVETYINTSQGALSRSLQGLFITPIQSSWNTLRAPAGQQLAKAWAQQVAKPWQRIMAHRYPIAAGSANEASVKDLQRFVDPVSGLLPSFKRNEIGNLAGGEGLGMGGSAKAAPLVNPSMVSSIDQASSLGQVIASLSDKENGFEIMLEPSSKLTDIIFTLDGQTQHYRNGKSRWSRFTWPGTTSTPGARMDVVNLNGERVTVFDYPGRWGLLKMTDSARVAEMDGVRQRFSWSVGDGAVSLVVRNYGGVTLTDLGKVKRLGALNDATKGH